MIQSQKNILQSS